MRPTTLLSLHFLPVRPSLTARRAVQLKAAGDGKGAGTLAALASRCRPEEAGLESAMTAALLQLAPQVRSSCSVSAIRDPGWGKRHDRCAAAAGGPRCGSPAACPKLGIQGGASVMTAALLQLAPEALPWCSWIPGRRPGVRLCGKLPGMSRAGSWPRY